MTNSSAIIRRPLSAVLSNRSIRRPLAALGLALFLAFPNCGLYSVESDLSVHLSALFAAIGRGSVSLGDDCVCVTEGGTVDSYTLKLDTEPARDVIVTVTPSSNVTVNNSSSPIELIFTPENYNQPQTITVTAVDDASAESNHVATITNVVTGGDPDFLGINLGTVSVNITDNDSAGVSISTTTVSVSEGSLTGSYTVVLTSQPAADVTISISADAQINAPPASITFTTSNWDQIQTITIVPVDDNIDENGIHASGITHTATSSDIGYNGLAVNGVTVAITDNDSAGVSITPSGGSTSLTEAGASDTYTVALTSQPTSDVTITIGTDAQLSDNKGGALTFTSGNWNSPQTVTLTAVNDLVAEGNHNSTVAHSASSTDSNYNGITISAITASITDNDSAGVSITQAGGTNLTEAGGTDTYTIVLTSQPTADVTVTIGTDAQVSDNKGGSVTFTSGNWNSAQTVTLTAVNDLVAEGTHNGTVTHSASSSDSFYVLTTGQITAVTASITDNDSAGVSIVEAGGSTNVTEAGGTDTYTVVLTSQPTADVTVTIGTDAQLSDNKGGTLTFTSGNWNTTQTVTLSAVNDSVAEGAHNGTVTHSASSSDSFYNISSGSIASITASITDNDSAGVSITEVGGSTNMTEGGGTDTYTVVLTSQPTADVTVRIHTDAQSSDNKGGILTFTSGNWNISQTVTLTAVNDSIAEGAHNSTVTHDAVSSDGNFNLTTAQIASVTASIADNDSAGVSITESGGSTGLTEGGATDSYTIVLTSQPVADVTVTIGTDAQASDNKSGSVTFTSADWNSPQTVTLTAVNDLVAEGNHNSTTTHSASSSDSNYNLSTGQIASITASITDNDSAGVSITESGGGTSVTEGGATDTYTVVLTSQPTADVTVTIGTDAQLTDNQGGTLTFTSSNWNIAQTVTLTAVNDKIAESTHSGSVNHSASSSDTNYNLTTAQISSLAPTIIDNDTAGVSITQSGGSTSLSESGTTDTYDIVLTSEPTSNVQVIINTDADTGDNSGGSLSFTAANWSTPQTVTLSAVNDSIAEGTHAGTITHSASSSDSNYNLSAAQIASITATITDNDTVGYTVSAISRYTNEAGGTATFTVRLNSEPTGAVTIGLSSSDTTEGTVSPSSLSFDALNWNTNQTVTVTGVNDFSVDGHVNYTIILATPSGSDSSGYSAANPPDVSVTNMDDDVRYLFRTSNRYDGNLGGVTGADTVCQTEASALGYPGTYKAMLADGTGLTRVACYYADCGTPHTLDGWDWVLAPATTYYRGEDGVVIGTTTSRRIFPFPLTNPITSDSSIGSYPEDRGHTGMSPSWRPATVVSGNNYDCSGWTSNNGGVNTTLAKTWEIIDEMLTAGNIGGCNVALHLYCARQ